MANDTYSIVSTAEVLDTSDVTNPVQAVRITYKSKATGATGTLTLPKAGLTPELVHNAVDAEVATLDAIHNL